ncbi:TPA: hypothetical protein ACGO9Z_000247 [Streptococcus suis]
MKNYQLHDFNISISDNLYPVYDGGNEILIISPPHSSVCCNVRISATGTLLIDTFWGVDHIISGKDVTIFDTEGEIEL